MAGTGVGKFSSTASSNTANLTVNFAENMAPSNVNNAARELMGHMRDMYEQLGDGYFEFGDGDGTYTVARGDADTITITSASDISSVYFAGRKIRITDGGANVVEGTIASSSHSSTTQTVNLTGISLASGTPTKVELGIDTAAFGGKVILDDDGDTYIEAPTDDTIDIYVAGAKDFVITANTFTAESGSTIAAQALTATGIDVTGAITATAASTITVADNSDNLSLISTDADGSSGPNLRMYRNSGSPADGDDLGVIDFEGRNDNSQDVVYAQIKSLVTDQTDGTEDGKLEFYHMLGGSLAPSLQLTTAGIVINESSNDIDFRVESNGQTHMLFVDGGNDRVNMGSATDVEATLVVSAGDSGVTTPDANGNLFVIEKNDNCGMSILSSTDGGGYIHFGDSGDIDIGVIEYSHPDNSLRFTVNAAERMRILSDGALNIGKTSGGLANAGVEIATDKLSATVSAANVQYINRLSNDGALVTFYQATSEEGSISVSGNTVSYNGFTGSHWSRLADNSKPTILRGTIMESIDEMCDWYQAVADVAEVKYTAEDSEVIDGDKNVGDVKTEAYTVKESIILNGKSVGDSITFTSNTTTGDGKTHTGTIVKEDDVKHNKSKVSDTADSKKVYGVFSNWDDADDGLDGDVNDMNIAQVGTYIIRVNADEVVQGGDLLVSNGDGTAKVQDDDIIRSKTVAKVNSTVKIETYADGSYTVPCTLHC